MKRYRYMVVKYHRDVADKIGIKDGAFVNHLPIHHLVQGYQAQRIDDEHMLVYAEYPVHNHQALLDHPHTLILPSVSSGKSLHKHGHEHKKHAHVKALSKVFNLDESHSMGDLVDALEGNVGPLLMPIR